MKILLSIKPEYALQILDGSKRFEFRKRVHKDERVQTVVIYATMPIGKVVGEFTIGSIHSERPARLWQRTKTFSGITRQFFDDYFQDRAIGHAIEVKQVTRYSVPKPIGDYLASGVPPQSFAYLKS